ncbi:MAG TPA: hypothetical protein VGL40_11815 [Bacillota bacterium]
MFSAGTERARPVATGRVSFGKASWAQVVASSLVTADGFSVGFAPRPGQVLAGGHCLPQVGSTYDDRVDGHWSRRHRRLRSSFKADK